MLLSGKTPKEIRQKIVVSASSISVIRQKLGIQKFRRGTYTGTRRQGNDKQISSRIREMKCAGKTYQEIGLAIGYTRQRIQQIIRDAPKEMASFCCLCGTKPDKIHYHHTSYSEAITIPVCNLCHKKLHCRQPKTTQGT